MEIERRIYKKFQNIQMIIQITISKIVCIDRIVQNIYSNMSGG